MTTLKQASKRYMATVIKFVDEEPRLPEFKHYHKKRDEKWGSKKLDKHQL